MGPNDRISQMTLPILYQGSGGTIGDLFLSSHIMYHQHTLGRSISVAIPKSLPITLKDLYYRHNFLKSIIEMDDISTIPYLTYCTQNRYESSLHITDLKYIKNVFHPLHEWFEYNEPTKPTIEPECIGFHITSTSNYDRPAIPHLDQYLDKCWSNKIKVVFMGSPKDEKLFNSLYPWAREMSFQNESYRFNDTLLQTIANIKTMRGMITFSSFSAYIAVLQGVPTIELWCSNQWQMFSRLVAQMIGSPAHYVQCHYLDEPSPYFPEVYVWMKNYATNLYPGVQ